MSAPLTKTEPQYEVQLAAPSAAQDGLIKVWKNLQVKGNPADKFHWTYEQAPYLPDTAFLLKTDNQVVGSAGYGIRTFRVAGEDRRVAVMADLAVDAEHRSLAPALALVKTGREFVQKQFDFAYGWPNSKAEGVFARARYKSLGRLHRYVRVTRYEAYVDRVTHLTDRLATMTRIPQRVASLLTRRPVAVVGTRVLSYANRVRHVGSTLSLKQAYTLHWTNLADQRIDDIWRTAQDEYKVIAERTSQFLRWRFANDNVRVALLTRKQSRIPCAYAVLRFEGGEAQIVDVFGSKRCLSPLLSLLFGVICQDSSVHALSCIYLGQSQFVQTLRECGFEQRDDKGRQMCICNGQLPAQLVPELEQIENWHLTAFDEDV